MTTSADPGGLVPFITHREGEDAAPDNLILLPHSDGRLHLHYLDEDPRDRDIHGVLWARCSFNPIDPHGQPTGRPLFKLMHPYRQLMTMQMLHCQVCTAPARTPLGLIFLAGPHDHTGAPQVLTNQPPVCARHVRTAARLCPHLDGTPTVYLAQSAPLYGATGTLYGLGTHGTQPIAQPGPPLPYSHPDMSCFLASQQIRRLASFRSVGLEELLEALRPESA
ncbi:hypothetical protein [Streptomyces asoensis]|uniref:HNH endonuclease n=1 Tax=Streptomyces asoensis TaxID=249586 RepID=A0ABQ3SC77_9ACTN|nr:hypothetical protein [Streptomyces asoensis]GGQ97599.1 hypothetical protein GCM10010496_73230 [Streptomyces asoensis]GHI65740.1 hypothetical protein Saso_73900 [Streptomyces asoensis]